MTQVRSTGLTPFLYSGTQPARIVGTPIAGEVDWRSIITSANTARVLAIVNGQLKTLTPGNTFSGFNRLEPGTQYLIQGKQAFELSVSFPPAGSSGRSSALAAVKSAIDALPSADFTFTVNNGVVSFAPTGLNAGAGDFILGYDWDFGDGSALDNSNSPTHVYTAIGTYTVRFRVMNNLDVRGAWVRKAIVITVAGNASPSPAPTPAPDQGLGNPPSGWVLRSALPSGASISEFWIGNSIRDETLDFVANAGVDEISALLGYNYTIARNMLPGSPLSYLRDNGAAFTTAPYGQFQNALANYGWDYITFQPFDRNVDDDLQAIGDFLDIAVPRSGANLQPWIYQRWMRKRQNGANDGAYWNQAWTATYNPNSYIYENRDFFNQLLAAVRANETRQKPALLVPVGEAFYVFNNMAMNGEVPGFQSAFDGYSDGIHVDDRFSYFVSVVFATAFNYRSFVGTAVPPGYGSIDPALANTMQQIAWNTVRNHPACAYVPA